MRKLFYIAVEGPIGVGKTSLANLISKELGARLVLEQFEENPFLPEFYRDPERYSFQTQLFFLLQRYRQQQELKQVDMFQTLLITDYLFVKDRIGKYQLGIDINSKPLKNKMIEINTRFRFEEKEVVEKKSYFEIVFSTIIKIDDQINDKKELQKIILCDVQVEIYSELKNSFENMLNNSGYTNMKIGKEINFEDLYNKRFN